MKALITGITGYVGTHLAINLDNKGHEVAGLYRPSSLPQIHIQKARLWPATDEGHGFREALMEFRPNVVIHLAAHYLPQHRPEDIGPLVRANIQYGAHLLEAMRESSCDAMVFAGTSWQHYHDANYCPANLYAATKQAFSSLADYYRDAHGLRFLELHLYDCYGPNDPRRKLLNQMKENARNTTPLPMSNGEQRIHLIHVHDLTNGLALACQQALKLLPGQRALYRMPSPKAISLRELVEQFNQSNPRHPLQVIWGNLPYREREIFTPWENGEILPGWEPCIKLAEGLRDICQ